MPDDPREVLKAAGAECAEVGLYKSARLPHEQPPYRHKLYGKTVVAEAPADVAILALARLVAEKQRLLILAYETDFRYIMSFDEWLADLPVDQCRPRDPGDPLHRRWEAHDA